MASPQLKSPDAKNGVNYVLHNNIIEQSGFRELNFDELDAVSGGHYNEELTDEYVQNQIALQSLTILERAAATEMLAAGIYTFGGEGDGNEGAVSGSFIDTGTEIFITVLGNTSGGVIADNGTSLTQPDNSTACNISQAFSAVAAGLGTHSFVFGLIGSSAFIAGPAGPAVLAIAGAAGTAGFVAGFASYAIDVTYKCDR